MEKHRVVITGMGILSSVGHDLSGTWASVKQGKTGVAPCFPSSENLPDPPLVAAIKNFDVRQSAVDRKLLKMISSHDVYGLHVIQQAILQSNWLAYRDSGDVDDFNNTTGIYIGSCGNKFYQSYDFLPVIAQGKGSLTYFGDHFKEEVNPMILLKGLLNNVLAYAGITLGFKGPNQNIVNHGVSGLQAIIEAFYSISRGEIARALVAAYDTCLDVQLNAYYEALGLLSKTLLRPFDENRDGTILADGAAALTLETYEEAMARGAHIYAEILSGDTTSEAMGIYSIRRDGDGVARVLGNVIKKSGLNAADLGVIVAHGNGTIMSDQTEACGIKQFLQNEIVPVTNYKWSLGHALSAGGVIDVILTAQIFSEKIIPGIGTLSNVAKNCMDMEITSEAQILSKPSAAIINRGFGGLNTSLVMRSV